ncbi:hypothetical protein N7U49_47540 [Streptomyces sp. AD2-2]|nr:hypothetical protein N7U49_47540 [Streptomyces sp. AD2-2]
MSCWDVLNILRRTRDGEEGTAEITELVEGFGQCFAPSRTAATFVTAPERALIVLSLDTPAVRDVDTAFALDHVQGYFDAVYERLLAVEAFTKPRHLAVAGAALGLLTKSADERLSAFIHPDLYTHRNLVRNAG